MKRFLIFLLFLGVSTFSFAQNLKFKPTIGLNTNIQNAPGTSNKKSKIGFDIGILTERDLKHNLSFEFGFIINKSNFSLERTVYVYGSPVPIKPFQKRDNINLTFFKIPMILNLKQHKKYPFSIGVGLNGKFLINSNSKYFYPENPSNSDVDKFEFATNVGTLGIAFQSVFKKEFSFNNKINSLGLYYDFDISYWSHYMQVLDPPTQSGFSTRASNFSLLFSKTL
jgi:hypothetical protein